MSTINTITDVLQAVHRKYEGDTNYPSAGSEDHTIRLEHANDAIGLWESEALDGSVVWESLISEAVVSAGGNGSDDLPSDFLSTYRADGGRQAYCTAGETTYRQVTPGVGNWRKKENITVEPVFWIAGGKIKTFPAATSDITLPYLRRAKRYASGTESDPLDVPEGYFLVYYVLSQLYATDRDVALMDLNLGRAEELMGKMKSGSVNEHESESDFVIGT
ncbi:MAG TPA: hypothetical protein ENJ77_00165 [Candidatus Moranbacteria bacterium]|nr:hypothetical protein [Candidatus Moranbacteria bacterium]